MNILSVAAYNCPSSVVIARGNKISAAFYEQQFSRRSNDCSFPERAIREAIKPHEPIDAILFSDATYYKRFCADMRRFSSVKPQLVSTPDALAMSAAIPYNVERSAVIAVNNLDDKHCISLGYYNGISITWFKHISAPTCLYSLYRNVLKLMRLNNDKYAMLAARSGEPRWVDWAHKNLISYGNGDVHIKHTMNGLGRAFLDYDIAASTQSLLQIIFVDLAQWLYSHLDTDSLIFAGNFSDNTDLITHLYKNTDFIQIASSLDPSTSSCSLGAIGTVNKLLWETVYLGVEANNNISADAAAFKILSGDIVPILQGRAEFNRRSHGNRSFLCIPSEQNIARLDAALNKPTWEPYKVICQQKEVDDFFDVVGNTRYAQATSDVIKTNYTTEHNKLEVQTITMTSNAYINRILEKTRQHGFPFLICADMRSGDKPLVNSIEDYNNEIQLYH